MKRRILLVHTSYSPFVKTDYEILSTEHKVDKYQYIASKGLLKTAFQLSKQFLFLLVNIYSYDIVYVWFADYHSFLPILFSKILKKKSYLVIGGYDVANFPELGYGSLTKPIRKSFTLFSFSNATLCIPVVEKLENKLKEICPKAKAKTIHTGYKFNMEEKCDFNASREKIILTVSITDNFQRFMIKGLDRFKELAEQLPDYKFYIIGIRENAKKLFDPIPSNLILSPPLGQKELTKFYLDASFYTQFSRTEGLPNALCEAMLYGCIPLGLDIGGIGTAIENHGLLMDNWNTPEVIEYISKNHNSVIRADISNHIIKKFDISHRVKKLLDTVSG
ncbi:MAG: glycosyltransferase family 4 protein [Bacteroidetes bacterium]|nr:glycosyltransferase family 4 protein [Bacteroidota bacterium]